MGVQAQSNEARPFCAEPRRDFKRLRCRSTILVPGACPAPAGVSRLGALASCMIEVPAGVALVELHRSIRDSLCQILVLDQHVRLVSALSRSVRPLATQRPSAFFTRTHPAIRMPMMVMSKLASIRLPRLFAGASTTVIFVSLNSASSVQPARVETGEELPSGRPYSRRMRRIVPIGDLHRRNRHVPTENPDRRL